MELLIPNRNNSLGDRLHRELRSANALSIAVAYFLPSKATINLLKKVPNLKLVVSGEFTINNPDKLKEVNTSGNVKLISPEDVNGRLHAKVIFGNRTDLSSFALVGSANLTNEALFYNQEACILFDSNNPGDVETMNHISTWLKDTWTTATRFRYREAKAIFDSAQHRWKRRKRTESELSRNLNYWVIKTTEGANGPSYWQQFLEEGVVAIGWRELPVNPANITSNELKHILETISGGGTTMEVSIAANTINKFVHEIAEGDLILISRGYPANSNQDVYLYGVCSVTGGFRERPGDGWKFVRNADIQAIERHVPKSLFVDFLGKRSLLKTIHKIDRVAFDKLCNYLHEECGITVSI